MENCRESCLDGIVTVSDFCSGKMECPSSGYDLMNAPEITTNNLASIANEKYVSGLNLARSIVKNATNQLKNDFIAVLHTNNFIANITTPVYSTSLPSTLSNTIPASPVERGITLFRNTTIRGSMKKVIINRIDVFPLNSVETQILIYDDGLVYKYSVQLIASQINTFQIRHVVQGNSARVVIDTSNLDVSSLKIACKTGCSGGYVNPCAYAQSFDGSSENKTGEAYGLDVYFSCQCDFDKLLCDLSQTYVGELIYLKSRIMLLDEQLRTNRFNDWVVYNRADILTFREQLQQEYVDKWNALVQGLGGILRNFHDDCIECRGIRWVVNG